MKKIIVFLGLFWAIICCQAEVIRVNNQVLYLEQGYQINDSLLVRRVIFSYPDTGVFLGLSITAIENLFSGSDSVVTSQTTFLRKGLLYRQVKWVKKIDNGLKIGNNKTFCLGMTIVLWVICLGSLFFIGAAITVIGKIWKILVIIGIIVLAAFCLTWEPMFVVFFVISPFGFLIAKFCQERHRIKELASKRVISEHDDMVFMRNIPLSQAKRILKMSGLVNLPSGKEIIISALFVIKNHYLVGLDDKEKFFVNSYYRSLREGKFIEIENGRYKNNDFRDLLKYLRQANKILFEKK